MSTSGWIGVDLDGTLAYYDHWRGVDHIGAPIGLMVERVKRWLADGKTVKIFTARMHGHGLPDITPGAAHHSTVDVVTPIKQWCLEHIGQELEVTNVKDFGMVELWDDRAVQVKANQGTPASEVISTLKIAVGRLAGGLARIAELDYTRAAVNGWAHTANRIAVKALTDSGFRRNKGNSPTRSFIISVDESADLPG